MADHMRRLGWLLCAMPGLCLAQAVAPMSALPTEFSSLAQRVLATGVPAQLPEHLSSELGLGANGPTPVRQLATRAGTVVHAYNVGVGRRHTVVLYTYDEATQLTKAWLLTPAGSISRALSYQAGAISHDLPKAEAQAGLGAEATYWIRFTRQPTTGTGLPAAAARPGARANPPAPAVPGR